MMCNACKYEGERSDHGDPCRICVLHFGLASTMALSASDPTLNSSWLSSPTTLPEDHTHPGSPFCSNNLKSHTTNSTELFVMAVSDDVFAHATSTIDFYELLSISASATGAEIRTAFRKTSLKYHPDKVEDTPENVEKFLLVKIAHDVLSDAQIRALYDRSREARRRKEIETQRLETGRRQMISELEHREKLAESRQHFGIATMERSRDDEEEFVEKTLAKEIQRISQENRNKKKELLARRERERLEQEDEELMKEEARARLKSEKAQSSSKRQKMTSQFVGRPQSSEMLHGHTTKISAEAGPTFEQTILQRLRMAQREKEKNQAIAEAMAESSQPT